MYRQLYSTLKRQKKLVNRLSCALEPKLLQLRYFKRTLKIKVNVVKADSCGGDKTAMVLT